MIASLRLQNFRSYSDSSFEFEPGVNIVVGPNASGKTNLLEALLVLKRGTSYRATDKELIQINKSWGRIEGEVDGRKRTVKLQLQNETFTKTTEVDSKIYKRLPSSEKQPVVLFEPNHLRYLSGSPEQRRSLFDAILVQTNPLHDQILKRYQRALIQRNHLLKQHRTDTNEFFVWDVRLSELAEKIVHARTDLIATMNKALPKLYSAIADKPRSRVGLSYQTDCGIQNYSSNLLKLLQKNYQLDQQKGFTSCGPHREDIHITLNKQPFSQTASRGEARTLFLALKITELDLVEEATDQKATLLLDDVFSELDGARRQALTKKIKDHQVFITTTDADVVVQHFMDNCHIIPLGS